MRSGGGSREDVMEAGSTSNATAGGSKAGPDGDKGKPPPAPHSCLLSFCRAINVAAGTAAILCLVAHLMALSISNANSVAGPRSTGGHTLLQVLRLYGCCTSLLCLVIEFEWDWVLAWVRGAENWIGRGLLQGFLGCFTLELASSEGTSEFERSLGVYRLVAGFAMIGTALIYFSGGLLCVGIFKKAQHRKVMERQRMERDIELLDRQREDLRLMLESYARPH